MKYSRIVALLGTVLLCMCLTTANAANTASKQFTLTVNPAPLQITTVTTLPSGQQGSAYTVTFAATGGVSPYSWGVASGSTLPAGVSLSASGTLSGTPTVKGTFNFSITCTDAANTTVTQSFSVTLAAAPALQITTVTITSAQVGVAYSLQLTASGGVAPYTWSLASGSTLPAGLTLSSSGLVSGTPTTSGSFTFTAVVTDSAGN